MYYTSLAASMALQSGSKPKVSASKMLTHYTKQTDMYRSIPADLFSIVYHPHILQSPYGPVDASVQICSVG